MTRTNPKRNKGRGADDERDHAHRLGGRRHLANTGGPEDVEHPQFAVQVKGGKSVTTATFRSGMDDAEEASLRSGKPPLLAITDRSGTTLRRYVAMPEEWFARLFLQCMYCDSPPVKHPRSWREVVEYDEQGVLDHLWTGNFDHDKQHQADRRERAAETARRLDSEETSTVD